MTLTEVRAIRERQSLETVGMTADELRAYFAKGASEAQKMIDEIRKNAGNPQSKTKVSVRENNSAVKMKS